MSRSLKIPYTFSLFVFKTFSKLVFLLYSHLTPNCAKSENKTPFPFYKSFSDDFYELWWLLVIIHLAIPYSLDYRTFTIALNSYILSLQQYYKPLSRTPNWYAQPSYFIWEQFSSPEWLAMILEKRKELKFLFVI